MSKIRESSAGGYIKRKTTTSQQVSALWNLLRVKPYRKQKFNMTRLVIALALLAVVAAAPQGDYTTPIPILRQSLDGPNPDGSYNYSYETANGIQAQEEGHLANVGAEQEAAMQVQGGYAYTAPDGTPIQISYIANENGFQPQGAHLPTTPPVPPQILRALEYIAAHPEENNIDSQ